MERFIPLAFIIGWFGSIFIGSYLINWLLVRSIIRRHYRYFVAPGVIIHEASHAIGCLVTGSPIVEINFWKPSGGHVKHLQPNDPFRRLINDPIIALAPIWGTLLFLFILSYFLIPDFMALNSPDLSSLTELFDLGRWQTWLYLYLVTSAIATMAPSSTDMRYALASLVVASLILVLLSLLPGFSDWLLAGLTALRPLVIFSLLLLTLAIVIAFLLALPARHQRFTPRNQLE